MEPHEGEPHGKRALRKEKDFRTPFAGAEGGRTSPCSVCQLIRSEFGSREIPVMPRTSSRWRYATLSFNNRTVVPIPERLLTCWQCGRVFEPLSERRRQEKIRKASYEAKRRHRQRAQYRAKRMEATK